jgi:hypothetical protein
MVDEDAERARIWLHTWQGMHVAEGEVAAAAGTAHAQMAALERASQALALDDEPWRVRCVLARRARARR